MGFNDKPRWIGNRQISSEFHLPIFNCYVRGDNLFKLYIGMAMPGIGQQLWVQVMIMIFTKKTLSQTDVSLKFSHQISQFFFYFYIFQVFFSV